MEKDIPNLLDKKQNKPVDILNLEKRVKIDFFLQIILVAIITGLLYFKSVRFALVHNKEATNFANAYVEMEKITKSAANQVLGEWVNNISVNKGN